MDKVDFNFWQHVKTQQILYQMYADIVILYAVIQQNQLVPKKPY